VGRFFAVVLAVMAAQQGAPLPPASLAARPSPSHPGRSWSEAEVLARKVAEVEGLLREGRPVPKQTVVVSEAQLNSYLNLTLAPQLPKGISNLDFHFAREGLTASALVDIDRLPVKGSLGFFSFLSGTIPVQATGRLLNADGQANVELDQLLVSGYSMPLSVLAQILAASTRTATNPQGFDMRAPFKLPYAMRSVRFEPGRAVVEF
jgi:hypothetical protein